MPGPRYCYQLKFPPCYDPDRDTAPGNCLPCCKSKLPCKTSACLPKTGNLFMSSCVGDYSCESLEYTRLFLNEFPLNARQGVLERVIRSEAQK